MAPSVILKYIFIESVDRLRNKFCITVVQKKKKAGNSKWILCDSLGKSGNKLKCTNIFKSLKGMAENLNKRQTETKTF